MLTKRFRLFYWCALFLLILQSIVFAEGRVIHHQITSQILADAGEVAERELSVYLPEEYDNSGLDYPVMYLIHGWTGTNRLFLGAGYNGAMGGIHINRMADQLIEEGQIEPLIVVLPNLNRNIASNLADIPFYKDNVVNKPEDGTIYAFCRLQSRIAGDVSIRIESYSNTSVEGRSEVAVWLNGRKSRKVRQYLRSYHNFERIFEGHVNAGENSCLIKISRIRHLAVHILPPNRAEITGNVVDDTGAPIRFAVIRLEQDNREIVQMKTDISGNYRLSVYPVRGNYDLQATHGELGDWRLDFPLAEGERRTLNLTLKEAVDISGTLLMLDGVTPHTGVPVQAVRVSESVNAQSSRSDDQISKPSAVATVLSDERGNYRLINLKPGRYRVRCQTPNRYVHYVTKDLNSENAEMTKRGHRYRSDILHLKRGEAFDGINFRFVAFKKGVWKNHNVFDGLPQKDVYALHRTPDGALWFGTGGGHVCRYDGKEFKTFTDKFGGNVSVRVIAFHRSDDDVLWFGTQGLGVFRFVQSARSSEGEALPIKTFSASDGLAGNEVRSIYSRSSDVLWFATDGGVSRYDGKTFVNFTTDDGLVDNDVRAIWGDSDCGLWFGTSLGVSRYDGRTFVNFTTEDGLVHNDILDIYQTVEGILWFATDGGVSRYDGKTFVNFTTDDGLAGDRVYTIDMTPDGLIWFGTNRGVSCFNGETYVNFTTADGLAGQEIRKIYHTPDGLLWFGTNNGISRYDREGIVNFTTRDGLANNRIFVVAPMPDKTLWIGMEWDGGIGRYDGTRFENMASNLYARKIYRRPDGMLYVGTNDGLLRYNGVDFENISDQKWVMAINRDPEGRLWLGSGWAGGGVSIYDEKDLPNAPMTTLTTEDGLGHDQVWAIEKAADGAWWFGTSGGASRYNGKTIETFTIENGLSSNGIFAIHCDTDNVLWFGTNGGVSTYDGHQFKTLTTNDRLASNIVWAVHSTPDGIVWFGTHSFGVSGYDGTAFTSLDTRDGLAGNSIFSIATDVDGFLWFGALDGGITRYRRTTDPPGVDILSVETGGQTYTDLEAVPRITTGSYVAIKYQALDFKTLPEKQQYRYRILSTDRHGETAYSAPTGEARFDWIPKKPGLYTFEVQAIDRDLNYSESASVTVEVFQPFYTQATFLVPTVGGGTLMCVMLVIQAIVLIKRHQQVLAYQRAAVEELKEARSVQMSLMPEATPELEGIEVAGNCIPAKDVSGDFFDYVPLVDDTLAIVLADVTGKGMRGAMNAVLSSGALHAEAKLGISPSQMLWVLNRDLHARFQRHTNCAMCIATVEVEKRVVRCANAGIPYPIVKRGEEIYELELDGTPLGGFLKAEYEEAPPLVLETGDIMIFYSDGITEAPEKDNPEQLYMETDCLTTLIKGFDSAMTAQAMIDAIIADVKDFSGDAQQNDDMTVVIIKAL